MYQLLNFLHFPSVTFLEKNLGKNLGKIFGKIFSFKIGLLALESQQNKAVCLEKGSDTAGRIPARGGLTACGQWQRRRPKTRNSRRRFRGTKTEKVK